MKGGEKMNVETRADGIHFDGYVNVTGKMSKPVITLNRQRVVETIEERAFQTALSRTSNVEVWLDHNPSRVVAQTKDNTLELREDSIGLKASGVITDPEVMQNAKRLKGWSFGMKKVKDQIEERADQLPIRHVKGFELDHIGLLMNKNPAYSATTIELRADEESESEIELRESGEMEVKDMVETPEETKVGLSQYQNRINRLKVGR